MDLGPSAPILWLLVILAGVWDIALRRIPNSLVVIGILFGAAYQTQTGGLAGLSFSLLGVVTGLLLLIGPFAIRVMGGGDVKLTMMCGAFLGWSGVIELTLLSSIVHGIMAVCTIIIRRIWPAAPDGVEFQGLPYAVSVVVGLLLQTFQLVAITGVSETLL